MTNLIIGFLIGIIVATIFHYRKTIFNSKTRLALKNNVETTVKDAAEKDIKNVEKDIKTVRKDIVDTIINKL